MATFGGSVSSGSASVTLDGANPSLAALSFSNTSASYTIAQGSGGSLCLTASGSSNVPVTVTGNHFVAAPVTLNSMAIVTTNNPTDSLLLYGSISGSRGLTCAGNGLLALLGGNNSYNGPTAIIGGKLMLANSAAVPTTSVLTVAANNGLAFAPGIGSFVVGALAGSGSFALQDSNGAAVTLQVGSSCGNYTFTGALVGPGGLTNTGGALTLGNANTYSGTTTISGGVLTLANSGATAASTVNVAVPNGLVFEGGIGTFTAGGLEGADNIALTEANGAAVTLRAGNNSVGTIYSGALSGAGGFTKTGSGTTTFSGNNSYTGATTVAAGQLVLQGNTQSTSFTAQSGGTLQMATGLNLYANSITAQSGGIVSYNNATVNGGYLRGPGTHITLPGSTNTFNGVTTYNSTFIQQNGTDNFNNFTNGGSVTNNAPLNWNGGVNATSGQFSVNATTAVQDWTNNGVLTVNGSGVINNSVSDIVFGGGSRTTINPGGQINANSDSSGSALDLNGALLVNNGIVTGTTNVNYGSLAQGTGVYGPVNVANGGTFKPGNSPGSVTTGSATWNSGAEYLVELNNANGTAGTNWNLWKIDGGLALSAGTTSNSAFVVAIESFSGSGPGYALNFDPTVDEQWLIADTTGGISGFNPADILVDTSQFSNSLDGGQFSVAQEGNNVDLVFTAAPTPEPGTLVMFCCAAVGLVVYRYRRRLYAEQGR